MSNLATKILAFELKKKIGFGAGCGNSYAGLSKCGDKFYESGIYQMRMTNRGKVPVKMKFYAPANPQTEAQQANRAKFASAVAAWQALTSEEKLVYTTRAKKRQMFGWGLFIREYYQAN